MSSLDDDSNGASSKRRNEAQIARRQAKKLRGKQEKQVDQNKADKETLMSMMGADTRATFAFKGHENNTRNQLRSRDIQSLLFSIFGSPSPLDWCFVKFSSMIDNAIILVVDGLTEPLIKAGSESIGIIPRPSTFPSQPGSSTASLPTSNTDGASASSSTSTKPSSSSSSSLPLVSYALPPKGYINPAQIMATFRKLTNNESLSTHTDIYRHFHIPASIHSNNIALGHTLTCTLSSIPGYARPEIRIGKVNLTENNDNATKQVPEHNIGLKRRAEARQAEEKAKADAAAGLPPPADPDALDFSDIINHYTFKQAEDYFPRDEELISSGFSLPSTVTLYKGNIPTTTTSSSSSSLDNDISLPDPESLLYPALPNGEKIFRSVYNPSIPTIKSLSNSDNNPTIDNDRSINPLIKDLIVSLDCEMVMTERGHNLARVSLVDIYGTPLLDIIVKPSYPVTDYLTQWSGITSDMINNTTITFNQAQNMVLSYINQNTILVGHSLENDLNILQLVHPYNRILDSSILYPHRRGITYKNSLKHLASQFLGISVQNGDNTDNGNSNTISSIPRQQLPTTEATTNSNDCTTTQQTITQTPTNDGMFGHSSVEDSQAALLLCLKKLRNGPKYGIIQSTQVNVFDVLDHFKIKSYLVSDDVGQHKRLASKLTNCIHVKDDQHALQWATRFIKMQQNNQTIHRHNINDNIHTCTLSISGSTSSTSMEEPSTESTVASVEKSDNTQTTMSDDDIRTLNNTDDSKVEKEQVDDIIASDVRSIVLKEDGDDDDTSTNNNTNTSNSNDTTLNKKISSSSSSSIDDNDDDDNASTTADKRNIIFVHLTSLLAAQDKLSIEQFSTFTRYLYDQQDKDEENEKENQQQEEQNIRNKYNTNNIKTSSSQYRLNQLNIKMLDHLQHYIQAQKTPPQPWTKEQWNKYAGCPQETTSSSAAPPASKQKKKRGTDLDDDILGNNDDDIKKSSSSLDIPEDIIHPIPPAANPALAIPLFENIAAFIETVPPNTLVILASGQSCAHAPRVASMYHKRLSHFARSSHFTYQDMDNVPVDIYTPIIDKILHPSQGNNTHHTNTQPQQQQQQQQQQQPDTNSTNDTSDKKDTTTSDAVDFDTLTPKQKDTIKSIQTVLTDQAGQFEELSKEAMYLNGRGVVSIGIM